MSLKSFLTRLIWICVLPLVLLSSYLAVDQVRSLQALRDLEAADLARNVATSLDNLLAARISALQVLAASPLLDDPPRLDEFYRQAQGFQQSFHNHLVLADLSRHMLLLTRVPFGTRLPDLPTVKGHSSVASATATGRPAVGDIYLGPVSRVPTVSIAVPVSRQGRMSLLLLSIVETSLFQRALDEIAIPPGCSLAVLDGTGELVARRLPASQGGGEARNASGRIVIKSALSPWSVVLTEPRDSYRAPIAGAAAALAAAVLGATLISFLGGGLAGRRLARSVASLAGAASQPPVPGPEIAEIETVRAILREVTTARQGAESTLRESEERYRSLVENAPMAIFINRDNRIEYANPEAVRLFGAASNAKLLGRSPFEIVHPEHHAAMAERIGVLARGGRVPLAETRIVQPDGGERCVEVAATRFTDRRGSAIQVMMHDISERKQAELALSERERSLSRAEEMAHLGHWRHDLVQGRLDWSDEMYRIFGLQPGAELPGSRMELLARFCHPDDLEQCAQSCDPMGRHDGQLFQYRILRPDGEERHVVSRGELLRDGYGEPAALFGTLLDTTKLRHKERELQEKNAELERFSYMISHDLKSPLVTIKTFLGYLERDLAGSHAERVVQDLEFMRVAADRMGRLLDELLELSRVGRVVNPPVAVSCATLVQEALGLVAGALAERAVEVRAELPDCTLVGDQARLVEIWQNLVENACKFLGDQPRPRLELGAQGSGRGTVFFVRDNGVGIEPQYQEKVFGLFEKLDRNAEGTGLGLALVRRVVELHGGKIWVESQGRGAGACFRFTLPGAIKEKLQGALS